MNSRKLSQYANLADGTEARTLIRRLNEWYDRTGRAFRIEEMAGGFRLMTRPKLGAWVKRLAPVALEVRLSAPALETLAIVAYRQPVLKAAVEAIRGVNSGEVLRQLMDRDLVRIVGRSEELGRPYLYGPTKRFLEVFGLRNLDDLPHREALQSTAVPPTNERATREGKHLATINTTCLPPQENDAVSRLELAQKRRTSQGTDLGSVPMASSPRAADDDFDDNELEGDDFDDDDDDDADDDEGDDEMDEDFDEDEEFDDEEEWDEFEDEEEEGDFEEDLEEDEWEEVEEDDEEGDDEEEEEDEDADWGDD